MDICIIGTGYVGLVTGACFAEFGNRVNCVDINPKKIRLLNQGVIPIYEPGLEELVRKNKRNGNLHFTTSLKEILHSSDIAFITVDTPMGKNGSSNLEYVKTAAKQIGQNISSDLIVVNKSTAPVGTTKLIHKIIQKEIKKREVNFHYTVVSNPEFLKEGAAVENFMRPDRVIIGSRDDDSVKLIQQLYQPFIRNHDRFIIMDEASAELTKYASNAFLATKISFINEIANISEKVGADINKVRIGIGSDKRIGYHFIYPGLGYGGSCFPKDIQSLLHQSKENHYESSLLKAVEEVNNRQKLILVHKVSARFKNKLDRKKFAVWGLTFKPNTDDIRESAAIITIRELLKKGAHIFAYDPKAMENVKKIDLGRNKNLFLCENKYDCLNDADALLLLTEWKEFYFLDITQVKKRLKNPIIFDSRNIYDKKELQKFEIEHHQIGVS